MFDFLLRSHMPDPILIRYRAGLLDQECSNMLEAHLLLCPTCQLQLAELLPPGAPAASCNCAGDIKVPVGLRGGLPLCAPGVVSISDTRSETDLQTRLLAICSSQRRCA